MENKIINQTASALGLNRNQVSIIKRFPGGMSNYTYHVKTPNFVVVSRIIGPGGEVFVDRNIELDHLKLVTPLKITNETLFFNLADGFKVSSYLPGVVLSEEILDSDYQLVANTLKYLHSKKIVGHDYQLVKRLNYYESLITYQLSSEYYYLKKMWLELYHNHYHQFAKVMCHGDAQRSNLVKNNNQVFLLDWEFSGMNDPYFDIASFGNINFSDSEILLEKYLGSKPTNEQLNRLRFNRMYQVLQWHLVATYKHDISLSSKLNIPFDIYASKYLAFARVLFDLMEVKNEIK